MGVCKVSVFDVIVIDVKLQQNTTGDYIVDGVCLSEAGMNLIKLLTIDPQIPPRKKRAPNKIRQNAYDKEAGILATIESVIAGGNGGKVS